LVDKWQRFGPDDADSFVKDNDNVGCDEFQTPVMWVDGERWVPVWFFDVYMRCDDCASDLCEDYY
jgi:hypothetical protein